MRSLGLVFVGVILFDVGGCLDEPGPRADGWISYDSNVLPKITLLNPVTRTIAGTRDADGACEVASSGTFSESSGPELEEDIAFNPITCERVTISGGIDQEGLAILDALDPASATPPNEDEITTDETSQQEVKKGDELAAAVNYPYSAYVKTAWIDPVDITITSLTNDLRWNAALAARASSVAYKFKYDGWTVDPSKPNISFGRGSGWGPGWVGAHSFESFRNTDFELIVLALLGPPGLAACGFDLSPAVFTHYVTTYGKSNGARGFEWNDTKKGGCTNLVHHRAWHGPGSSATGSSVPTPVPTPPPPAATATNTYITLGEVLNGQPGYVSVSGNVLRANGEPASGTVNVNFQKLADGAWTTMSTAHPTLSNGRYDVAYWRVGVGRWRVRAVFPEQGDYVSSESDYHQFEVKSGYRLVNRHSDKCMSLSGNNGANGTAMLQWDCSGSPSPGDGQVFTLLPVGGGDFNVVINSTGKCVDVTGLSPDDGAYLQQWDCLGPGQRNQVWRVIPIAGQPPYVAFQAQHSGRCADVLGGGTGNGTRCGCQSPTSPEWRTIGGGVRCKASGACDAPAA